jgi:hypothetical protein
MREEKTSRENRISPPMQKRRETMADGRRYIIFYSFENAADSEMKAATEEVSGKKKEVNEDV